MAQARNQPQYDLITGAPLALNQSRRGPLRTSLTIRPDASNEEFRTLIHKLQYELDSLKQEREATTLRHEEELRQERSKAEAEYRRAQTSVSSSHATAARLKKLESELQEVRDESVVERGDLEKKLRVSKEECRVLQEELEDLKSEQSSAGRQLQRDYLELEGKHKSLQETCDQTRRERDERATALHSANERLSQRERESGELENDIIRLRAQVGDAEDHELIKKELSEQVDHIKKLEATNLDQSIELKRLRERQKAVDVVEEEKRSLQSKLNIMNDLRRELSEAQLQRQMLEDERKSWTSYLEAEGSTEEDSRFDSPEDLAKAYIKQKLENASLVDKLGKVTPELTAKDQIIESLEDERARFSAEASKLRLSSTSGAGGSADIKARTRLERQRVLAVKEVEYLRAQLKTFDAEESEFQPEQYDAQKAKRIAELEDIVDGYRAEVSTLHASLTAHESSTPAANPAAPSSPLKRPRSPPPDERLGELSRKNRTLQEQLSQLTTAKEVQAKELLATKSQLTALKSTSRTRILELRHNPTTTYQSFKSSMVATLKEENTALLARLEAPSAAPSAPNATLDRLRLELQDKESALLSAQKHTARLKSVFAAKTREWRQTVAATLGWDFDFLPNGRVRVTSTYNPGLPEGAEGEGDEGGNSIIFDAEKGTMKCSGGPRSAFANEIDGEIRFWVDEKREVACFLATLTLKFWDETTKALRVI